MFVVLAKKKVKRQCSSKRFMKKKATVELPKQGREQQVQESKRQKKNPA
jgi:DNA-directed RNA polymerase subunit RPC12/RpoP